MFVRLYALIPIEGSVDHLIDELRDTYGAPLPAADLLTSNAYETLMEDVTDIKDLGAGVIGGRVCDHFAFRAAEVDWQIWIAQGDKPFPCRFEIATRDLPSNPRYRVDVRDWRGGETPSNDTFTFVPPDGATENAVEDYTKQFNDLPDNYVVGDSK